MGQITNQSIGPKAEWSDYQSIIIENLDLGQGPWRAKPIRPERLGRDGENTMPYHPKILPYTTLGCKTPSQSHFHVFTFHTCNLIFLYVSWILWIGILNSQNQHKCRSLDLIETRQPCISVLAVRVAPWSLSPKWEGWGYWADIDLGIGIFPPRHFDSLCSG